MRRYYPNALLILMLCAVFAASAPAFAKVAGGGSDGSSFTVSPETLESWKPFEGLNVESLSIDGLVRTRETAVRWIMRTETGKPFVGDRLALDLQRLYNTTNLYDLVGLVTPSTDGKGVDVKISLKDKWTLFPVFGAQGGGGSTTFGGGVFESNLFGYLANGSILAWQFNGTTSYDINTNQEYLLGTQTMWSIDVQDSIEPQTVHSVDGTALGTFAWRRQQKELMIGTHLPGPVRLMFYASLFQDSVFENDGNFTANTPPGFQQRIYPKLIYGRDDWTNYLENGYELTIQPTLANFIGSGPLYAALEVDFKYVTIVGPKHRDNIAAYFSTSNMGAGGPDYLYQVGGYYNVRGFSDLREFGRRLAYMNLEYRPFLFSYRWQLFDLDLMAVQGCLFSDAGSAWGDPTLTGEQAAADFRPLWSAGAGLRINMVKFAGAILRLDLARTIRPDEGVDFSFGVGQFF